MQVCREPYKFNDMSSARPINPSDRIATIDILRGMALFIVLIINTTTEFRVSIFQQFLPAAHATGLADQFSEAIILALHTKGFILFSFLFGVGLAIQFERLAGNERRLALMIRRLAILLAIGVVHLFLIWNGDILTEYAIVGLVALPFLYGTRWLLAAASVLSLGLYIAMASLPPVMAFPDQGWIIHHVEAARQAYGGGSFMEILAFRIDEVRYVAPLHVYVMPRTFGLFLLGAWVWRSGLFRTKVPAKLLIVAACLLLAIGAWLTVAAENGSAFGSHLDWRGSAILRSLAQLVLAAGYGVAHRRSCRSRRNKKTRRMGRPAGTHGFYKLHRSIDRAEFCILRFRSGPVRATERRTSPCDRGSRLRGASGVQRMVAAAVQIWSHRMALAFADVWRTPARYRAYRLT